MRTREPGLQLLLPGRAAYGWAARMVVALLAAAAIAACGRGGDDLSHAPIELAVPAASGSGQPHLAAGPGGEVVLSWLEPDGEGHALQLATLDDSGWSSPRTVAVGADFFVNWADFPSVVPITSNVWTAHWLVLAPDNFHAYDIMMSVSNDGGHTWGAPFMLHDDGTETEHGFVSLFAWGDAIGAVWLDGRKLADVDYEALERELARGGEYEPVGMTLRYARLAHDGRFLDEGEIDALVCDCCQTDVAVADGVPVIAYRDRTQQEIRDIVVRRIEGGQWSEPVQLGPDNWYITGCPVNGPAVAARGEQVAAAWFTGVENRQQVRFAFSRDGGRTFAPPVNVDGDGAFGHVGVVLLEDGDAAVSWWRRSTGSRGLTLAARRVAADGTLGPVQELASSGSLRPIDVPQIARAGDALVFAWTDAEGDGMVRSVRSDPPPR